MGGSRGQILLYSKSYPGVGLHNFLGGRDFIIFWGGSPNRAATQRNATQRNATQRNATQRNATQRNALPDCKDVSADKTSVVSAAKTSVVSADKTSVVSADISQDIPPTFSTQGRPRSGHPCVHNAWGMSWETADILSAATTDLVCWHKRCLVC